MALEAANAFAATLERAHLTKVLDVLTSSDASSAHFLFVIGNHSLVGVVAGDDFLQHSIGLLARWPRERLQQRPSRRENTDGVRAQGRALASGEELDDSTSQ